MLMLLLSENKQLIFHIFNGEKSVKIVFFLAKIVKLFLAFIKKSLSLKKRFKLWQKKQTPFQKIVPKKSTLR
jgi:hypothetical protein